MIKKRRRKNSLRLPGFNYQEPRMYAIVLNTVDRMHLFGQVIDAVMYPSPIVSSSSITGAASHRFILISY
jgi:hypothetical protein